jgi:MFS family permease
MTCRDGTGKVSCVGGRESVRVGRFVALREPRYRTLFLSGMIIFLATHAQQIARGWLAKELTGSNAGLGGVYLAFGAAMGIASVASGVVADRFPKRTVLMVAQGLIMAGALMIAIADSMGVLRYWMLVVASVLHGAGMANMGPARISFTAELVERRLLPNAIVLTQMSVNTTRILGPAIAGTLIGIKAIGTHGVYIITTSLCALSIYWTARLPKIAPRPAAAAQRPLSSFTDGLHHVRARPRLAALVIVANSIAIIGLPYVAFLPSIAKDIFDRGSGGFGLLSTCSAVAALAMSFWIAGRVRAREMWFTQAFCGSAFGFGLLLLSIAPTFLWAIIAIFVLGASSSGFQVSNNTLITTLAEHEYQGRVQALMMLGFSLSSMVALPIGYLADRFGLRQSLAVMGSLCTATMALYALARPRIAARAEVVGMPPAPAAT